ncbi:MAG: hypothetical protein R8F63_19205 [Acidimicrobiales bacterium]|nr:hypothetical protein [Acidimicrobiales bacterium]GJM39560.1 MAG: hypothetical protein DHS20C19_29270 [Acidimicrobiales bacterium]
MSDEPTDEPPAHPRRDFAIAYAFWVIVFLSIAVSIWLTSSELSAFRYAGF